MPVALVAYDAGDAARGLEHLQQLGAGMPRLDRQAFPGSAVRSKGAAMTITCKLA